MHINKLEINNIRVISKFKMDFPQPAGWHPKPLIGYHNVPDRIEQH
jgi:hypothetical protein